MCCAEDIGHYQAPPIHGIIKSSRTSDGCLDGNTCRVHDFGEIGLGRSFWRCHSPRLTLRKERHVLIQVSVCFELKSVVYHRSVDDIQRAIVFTTESGIVDTTWDRVVIRPVDVRKHPTSPVDREPVVVDVAQALVLAEVVLDHARI